jgi:hypothetical protein
MAISYSYPLPTTYRRRSQCAPCNPAPDQPAMANMTAACDQRPTRPKRRIQDVGCVTSFKKQILSHSHEYLLSLADDHLDSPNVHLLEMLTLRRYPVLSRRRFKTTSSSAFHGIRPPIETHAAAAVRHRTPSSPLAKSSRPSRNPSSPKTLPRRHRLPPLLLDSTVPAPTQNTPPSLAPNA